MKVTTHNTVLTAETLRGNRFLRRREKLVGQHKRSVAGDRPLDRKHQKSYSTNHSRVINHISAPQRLCGNIRISIT